MPKLTETLKAFIARPEVVKIVATVNPDGSPNIGPKGTTHIFDDESLAYLEVAGGRHWENVRRDPRVVVTCIDWAGREGYRLIGEAEVYQSGEVYERILQKFFKPDRPPPKAGVRIRVKEVHILRPGKAGEKVM